MDQGILDTMKIMIDSLYLYEHGYPIKECTHILFDKMVPLEYYSMLYIDNDYYFRCSPGLFDEVNKSPLFKEFTKITDQGEIYKILNLQSAPAES